MDRWELLTMSLLTVTPTSSYGWALMYFIKTSLIRCTEDLARKSFLVLLLCDFLFSYAHPLRLRLAVCASNFSHQRDQVHKQPFLPRSFRQAADRSPDSNVRLIILLQELGNPVGLGFDVPFADFDQALSVFRVEHQRAQEVVAAGLSAAEAF